MPCLSHPLLFSFIDYFSFFLIALSVKRLTYLNLIYIGSTSCLVGTHMSEIKKGDTYNHKQIEALANSSSEAVISEFGSFYAGGRFIVVEDFTITTSFMYVGIVGSEPMYECIYRA